MEGLEEFTVSFQNWTEVSGSISLFFFFNFYSGGS